MPLAQCPDCGGKVSTDADACPHCGRPTARPHANIPPPPAKKPTSPRTIGCFVIAGVLGLILLISICSHTSSDRDHRPGTTSTGNAPSTSPGASVVYATKAANIRRGASTSHTIARKAAEGEQLEYLAKSGEWYKLASSKDGAEEWIHESTVMTEAEKRYRDSAELKLGNWSWRHEYDYAIAEGQVTNVSGASLDNVMAVVTFKTATGQFVTSDDALVDYNPLLPGQTTPWKVMARWNPSMGTASVEFKTMFGGTLRTYRD